MGGGGQVLMFKVLLPDPQEYSLGLNQTACLHHLVTIENPGLPEP